MEIRAFPQMAGAGRKLCSPRDAFQLPFADEEAPVSSQGEKMREPYSGGCVSLLSCLPET